MKLHVKRARTCIGKNTAKIQGAEIFNGLPNDITNCKTEKLQKIIKETHYSFLYNITILYNISINTVQSSYHIPLIIHNYISLCNHV